VRQQAGNGSPRFQTDSPCGGRIFSTDLNCFRLDKSILTVFSRWRQQTGSSFRWRFPVWRTWFLDGLWLFEGCPVDFSRWTRQRPVWKTTSSLLPPPWKTLGIDQPYVYQLEFIKNYVPHIGNRCESAYPAMSSTLANRRKWLDQLFPLYPMDAAILEQILFIHHIYKVII